MDIYFIIIAQKDKINGKVENCIQDRNKHIMLLTQLWVFESICQEGMLTLS